MLYQLAPMLYGDDGLYCDASLPMCYHHCSNPRQCHSSSASSKTITPGMASKPSGCVSIIGCAFNRVVGAEAGFYQASNVSILMHRLGTGDGRPFAVQNRMLGQISTEYRGRMGAGRCLQLYDAPDCTGPTAKVRPTATCSIDKSDTDATMSGCPSADVHRCELSVPRTALRLAQGREYLLGGPRHGAAAAVESAEQPVLHAAVWDWRRGVQPQ